MSAESAKNRDWKKISIWLLLLLLVMPYMIYLIPQYLGMGVYVVSSGSMAPEMPKGSLVFERWHDPSSYQEGDVVIFRPNSSEIDEDLVVHRIVEVREGNYTNYFKTQGDANSEPDPGWTPGYNVIGERNFWIPYIGYYIIFTSGSPLIYLIILLPAALIIRSQLVTLLDALEEEKESQTVSEESSEDERVPVRKKDEDENRYRVVYDE